MEPSGATNMRCHYEVLGIAVDADPHVLRTAYKRCALRWHPDKNLDNVEKAKEEFQLVQQAFEVLSDPHERAWYDQHREAILKGGMGKDYKDDSINLFPYFSASCFQGYGDDEKGFFSVYRELFSKIYYEEMDVDLKEEYVVPTFGRSDSSYEEVVHYFYSFWENSCTAKTFVWLDEFDVREAPNRRVARLMEKENKKLRERARRQRSEEIRELVRFVRKRDRRVEEHRKFLEKKAAENIEKGKLNRLRQIEERNREIAQAVEAEWAKMDNFEGELKELEKSVVNEFGDYADEGGSDEDDSCACNARPLYCMACNRIFKTEKSFMNHESSKKHKDNVAALFVLVDDLGDDSDCQASKNSAKEEDINSQVEAEASGKKKNKGKKVLKPIAESDSNGNACAINSGEEDGSSEDHFMQSKKHSKRRNKKKNSKAETVDTDLSELLNSVLKVEDADLPEPAETREKSENKSKKKQGDLTKRPPKEGKDLGHTCAVCCGSFNTKNRLFAHLRATGHSVPLPRASVSEKSAKQRNKDSKYSSMD